MSFFTPNQQDVDREGRLEPKKGRADVCITNIECKRSRKGDPMMVFTETVDSGEDAGKKIKEYFAFSDGNTIVWSRLACLCDAAGFTWEPASSLEAFAAQFPLDTLRFSVEIDHRYSITAYLDDQDPERASLRETQKTSKAPYEKYLDVAEEEYEAWEGDKRIFAGVRDGLDFQNIYQKPQGEGMLVGGDGAVEEAADYFEDDGADLPF